MYIFYDFETSTRDFLGQILSYAFIVTDEQFLIQEELNGYIQLKRTEIPELGAIQVNKLNLDWLQENGDPEYVAAEKIAIFLGNLDSKYKGGVLVGFNTNRFDLNFLRNLLVRYGFNPYFSGHFTNRDVLQYAQYLALENVETFPWCLTKEQGKSFYAFKLEGLSEAFGILESPQTHGARDDVMLTIALVKAMEARFQKSFADFQPIQLPSKPMNQTDFEAAKMKSLVYDSQEQPPQKWAYRYYLKLFSAGKGWVFLDLDKSSQLITPTQDEKLACLRYINPNKHMLVLETLEPYEDHYYTPIIDDIRQDTFWGTLTPDIYFELIKKPWDIEYQIHELGFKERIDILRALTKAFLKDPNRYLSTLQELWTRRTEPKDLYIIQLYNRLYLNFHPNPDPKLLRKYINPRYVTGTMLKDNQDFVSLADRTLAIQEALDKSEGEEKNRLCALMQVIKMYIS